MAERSLSDYVNNPNIRRTMAERERVARPAVSGFNVTQNPYYFGNSPVSQVTQQDQAPASTSIPKTPEIQPTSVAGGTGGTGRTGEALQRISAQSNRLTSTSGDIRIPSGNKVGNKAEKVPTQSDRLTSIVDYLNADGANSSFANRKKLAQEMGIRNYVGSAQQNTQLINLLRQKKDGELTSARMEIPSMAQPAPAIASIPTPSLSKTLLALNRKGGLIKKAQKGTKTKEKYIGNNET